MHINKKIYLIFAVLLLAAFTNLSAQSLIKGIVSDAETNELMVGVRVAIKETQRGTITNSDGEFNLPVKQGNYTIVFSYMGYESVTRRVTCSREKPEQVLNISLNPSALKIDEIVVTAKSEAREIREQAMPIAVITMNELQGTVSDINDVIAKTSGVTIRATGGVGSSSRISVRGLEGKRIGFYLDGSPMSDNSDFININDIPVDLIERIEIYKGIVPPKFGGSALGGAVNIVIKEYPPKYMDASYSIESFNTHKVTGVFKRGKNKLEGGVGGSYTYSDNNYEMELPKKQGTVVTREHDKFKKVVIGGGFKSYKWYFDETSLEPAITYSRQEIQGIEDFDIKRAETSSFAFQIGYYAEKTNFLIEGLDLDLDNSYTYSYYTLTDTSRYRYDWNGEVTEAINDDGVGLGEIGIYPNTTLNKQHAFYQGTNLNYILNKTNAININSQLQYSKGLPSDTLQEKVIGYKTSFNSNIKNWTLGLTHEFNSVNKKFTNAASIKYYYYSLQTKLIDYYDFARIPEEIDNTKTDYGFSNAMRYRFTPDFLIKASAAYDLRMPSNEELLGDGYLTAPAGNLDPERNTAFNIGLMYDKTNEKHNRLQIEVNVFYQYLEDMVRYTMGNAQNVYKNFGEMRSLGGEAEVKWDANTWLYLWGNVTYQDLRDTRKKEAGSSASNPTYMDRMPNIPYFFSNGGFEFHKENLFGGSGQNTRLFGDCSFVEEYFYDFEQSIYQKRRIPRSFTFNLGLEHSLRNQSVFFSVQANNITDASVISEYNRPLPGRNFGAKIRYVFK